MNDSVNEFSMVQYDKSSENLERIVQNYVWCNLAILQQTANKLSVIISDSISRNVSGVTTVKNHNVTNIFPFLHKTTTDNIFSLRKMFVLDNMLYLKK